MITIIETNKYSICMRRMIITLFLSLVAILSYAQTSGDNLKINDTRTINDSPNFIKACFRADFKWRNVIGVPGIGNYSSNITIAPWYDSSGNLNHQLNFNDGGIFYRTGSHDATAWNVWKKIMIVNADGSVPDKLVVGGTIYTREVKVEVNAGADHVFKPDYDLKPLNEVEAFIRENNHLPEIASEKQMQQEGLNVNEFQIKLLQKIEELTLYVIELKKENEIQQTQIEQQKELIQAFIQKN